MWAAPASVQGSTCEAELAMMRAPFIQISKIPGMPVPANFGGLRAHAGGVLKIVARCFHVVSIPV